MRSQSKPTKCYLVCRLHTGYSWTNEAFMSYLVYDQMLVVDEAELPFAESEVDINV